jgi:hypothetical protein
MATARILQAEHYGKIILQGAAQTQGRYREGEPMEIRADVRTLREVIGWSPRFDL